MRRRAGRALAGLMVVMAGCRAPCYELDLEPAPGTEERVVAAARAVDRDLPDERLDEPGRGEAARLLALAAGGRLEPELGRRLLEGEVAVAFASGEGEERAFHQVTAGLLPLPLEALLRRFEPAHDWGLHLARYLGGALAVDRADEAGRATFQRERMVLAPPWYAVGAPDMDMSKYEVIERVPGAVTVYWTVARSANGSVLRDDGYVRFREVEVAARALTLVVFNSVHRVDPGWAGGLMPASWADGLTCRVLRETFSADVARYREVLAERVPGR